MSGLERDHYPRNASEKGEIVVRVRWRSGAQGGRCDPPNPRTVPAQNAPTLGVSATWVVSGAKKRVRHSRAVAPERGPAPPPI